MHSADQQRPSTMAEHMPSALSRIAALAIARLDHAAGEQGKAERDLAAVKAMLQEIESAS